MCADDLRADEVNIDVSLVRRFRAWVIPRAIWRLRGLSLEGKVGTRSARLFS